MDSEKGWTAYHVSTADRDYDFTDIFYDGKNVATIRKSNNELVVSWLDLETELNIPLDWFLELLQGTKRDFLR